VINIANGITEVVVIPPGTEFIGAVKIMLKFKWLEAILIPIYHPQVLVEKFL
jgi:hypothetical protein